MHPTLAAFLDRLFIDGRVRVARPNDDTSEKELRAMDEVLMAFETQYRQDLPGTPPPLAHEAARWGAVMLYRACQFAAYRDLGEAEIAHALGAACPGDDSPATHYSVDLTFRYLPDLVKLARSTAEGDPLMSRLAHWAEQWPLSSVGIADAKPSQVEAIVNHPCLLRLYVDRIMARRDTSRLANPRVRDCVRESLGMFPEMAPEMASCLQATEPERNGTDEKGGS
jgi:hypothetical protein